MKSSLSATHLLRVFALYGLVTLFILTLTRAGFSLWRLSHVESVEGFDTLRGFADLFVMGWRYDLALVGAVLLVPVTLGTFLSMLGPLRVLGRIIIIAFLFLGILAVLIGEYVTPYFLHLNDARPDLEAIKGIENPAEAVASLWSTQLIPAVIGLVLMLLIFIAFLARLEMSRLLRFRIAPLGGITLMIVGGALCVFAMISSVDFIKNPGTMPSLLTQESSKISEDTLVNELSLNTAFKAGSSMVASLPLPSLPK